MQNRNSAVLSVSNIRCSSGLHVHVRVTAMQLRTALSAHNMSPVAAAMKLVLVIDRLQKFVTEVITAVIT
jgi:hypothetical protein